MKISIITVAFNSETIIERTIISVLKQTYQNIDYWIIDGKSQDGTINIVKKYIPLFKGRLHWISEPDKGIYNAMNKGLKFCNGDIVGFLNSDDWFSSETVVEKIAKAFSQEGIDAVYGNILYVSKTNREQIIYHCNSKLYSSKLLRFGIAPPHPTFYAKKSLFQKYGGFNEQYKIAADFDLIARLIYKFKIKIKYLNFNFVTMTIGGASTKDDNAFARGLKETLFSCEKLGIKTNKLLLNAKKIYAIIASHI